MRERERERDRQRDRQTDRQTDGERRTERQSERVRETEGERHAQIPRQERETHKYWDKETRQRQGLGRDPVPWQRDPLWFCPDSVLLFLPLRWFWPPLSWCTLRHCSLPGTSGSPAVKKQQCTPLWCITSHNQIPATHSDLAARTFFCCGVLFSIYNCNRFFEEPRTMLICHDSEQVWPKHMPKINLIRFLNFHDLQRFTHVSAFLSWKIRYISWAYLPEQDPEDTGRWQVKSKMV